MLEKIQELIKEPLSNEGIDVLSVSWEVEEGVKNLMIVIDKKPYVDLDTCVKATHIINPIIDKMPNIIEDYLNLSFDKVMSKYN